MQQLACRLDKMFQGQQWSSRRMQKVAKGASLKIAVLGLANGPLRQALLAVSHHIKTHKNADETLTFAAEFRDSQACILQRIKASVSWILQMMI